MGLLMRNSERRTSNRIPFARATDIVEVKLASETILGIDISTTGVSIECGIRLLPGSKTRLKIIGLDGEVGMSARVVRSHVTSVGSSKVRYRAALAFDKPLTMIERACENEEDLAVVAVVSPVIVAATLIGSSAGIELVGSLNDW